MFMQFFRHESYSSHDVIHQATSPECLASSVGHVFLRLSITNQTFSTTSSDDIIENSSIIRESIGKVGQVYPDSWRTFLSLLTCTKAVTQSIHQQQSSKILLSIHQQQSSKILLSIHQQQSSKTTKYKAETQLSIYQQLSIHQQQSSNTTKYMYQNKHNVKTLLKAHKVENNGLLFA